MFINKHFHATGEIESCLAITGDLHTSTVDIIISMVQICDLAAKETVMLLFCKKISTCGQYGGRVGDREG